MSDIGIFIHLLINFCVARIVYIYTYCSLSRGAAPANLVALVIVKGNTLQLDSEAPSPAL